MSDEDIRTKRNSGWMLIFGVAFLQTLSATFLLAFSGSQTFEADTGVAWSELSSTFPTVATQFTIVQGASLVATLAVGLLSLSIIYFGLRKGRRWAWFAAWILPAWRFLIGPPAAIELAAGPEMHDNRIRVICAAANFLSG